MSIGPSHTQQCSDRRAPRKPASNKHGGYKQHRGSTILGSVKESGPLTYRANLLLLLLYGSTLLCVFVCDFGFSEDYSIITPSLTSLPEDTSACLGRTDHSHPSSLNRSVHLVLLIPFDLIGRNAH